VRLPSSVAAGVVVAALAIPAGAIAQDAQPAYTPDGSPDSARGVLPPTGGGVGGGEGGPKPAKINLKIDGLKGGKAKVGDRIQAIAKVKPFVGHQEVEIKLGNRGDTVMKRTPFVRRVKGKNFGRVKLRSKPLIEAGKYRVRVRKERTANQAGAVAKSKQFGLKYPDLDPGDSGPAVEVFNDLLR
jgi:hypothetical protein